MKFAIVIVGLGSWLVLDGLYSIFEYGKQTLQEHLIRVIRAGVGYPNHIILPLRGVRNMNDCRLTMFFENGQTKHLGDQGA
jgi:hypothetical protein